MTSFRINYKKFAGLSLWLVVTLICPAATYAQSQGVQNDEGLSSYIFSPRAVTVLLVLILIVQLVYRHRVRSSNRAAPVMQSSTVSTQQPAHSSKIKRYDRDEISKLLKASATTRNNGRSLEEAIRLSQVEQDDLLGSILDYPHSADDVAPVVEEEPHSIEFESSSIEVASHPLDSEPPANEETRSVGAESTDET